MITNLRVKNLKAWGEQLWQDGIDLAPLTLLLGPNSAGKTSLLQAPLLLKQTLDQPAATRLNPGGHPGDLVDLGDWETLIHDHDVGRELGLGVAVPDGDGGTVALTMTVRQVDGVPVLRFPTADGSADPVGRVRAAMDRIAYVGPLRLPPERTYPWEAPLPAGVGRFGELAVPMLIAHERALGDAGGRSWLLDQVSVWLARLGVADGLDLVRHGERVEALVVRDGRRANLKDVGFGVSQVLPLLVLAHTVPPGTTIVAEQPDTHLHPRSQAGLAELMAEIARARQVQFLVETHSEYVFRRLQTLVAEEALRPAECRFYLAERDEAGQAGIVRLQVDEFGRVANWPKHLFGDTVGETERRTRRMLERLAQRQEPPQP